ncbi:MAG: hypothetical protein HFF70_12705 [Oscillospiraceae bacterium]|nr:hypothetical protein [Oscillospiraceae bacterium]
MSGGHFGKQPLSSAPSILFEVIAHLNSHLSCVGGIEFVYQRTDIAVLTEVGVEQCGDIGSLLLTARFATCQQQKDDQKGDKNVFGFACNTGYHCPP